MKRSLLLLSLTLLGAASPLRSQVPPPGLLDPAAMEQLRQSTRRMMNPAAVALDHRAELQLSDSQVRTLEPASVELDEAQTRIMQRMDELQRQLPASPEAADAPLDEAAIRAHYRVKADLEADLMIRLLRAQRLVAQTLTAEQQDQLQKLQMSATLEILNVLRR